MSQWLPPGQQGYQYPQQTGFNQQQLQPQPTGYPGGGTGFLQPQRTGYAGAGYGQQQLQGAIPPVPPLPGANANYLRNFQQPPQQQPQQQFNAGLGSSFQPQQGGFLNPSPTAGGPLTAQPTGFGTASPLVAQRTGYSDPRLQMMSSTFMPANISAPYAPSGAPEFAGGLQGNQSLQQSFQQVNQNIRGTAAPKVPWALSRDERKNYDQIFRAWDPSNSGFISGDMALEVFGQSGLDRNDLATIWSLADQDNRGKLNIQEFHVAMGLIYRRLNGNELPAVLPPEMEPVSSKNLGESVDFLKDLLKNDTQVLGPNDSRGKVHSFRDSPSPRADPRKDGTIYKHDDSNVKGYASSSRRINRDNVRSSNATPTDNLADIKRRLASTEDLLDKARAAEKDPEDEALEQELEDLRYRVSRVQDDIDYVSRGPRTSAKEAERRKLERKLNELMYNDVPEVEQKIEDRERRKAREKADWSRDRDRRNANGRSRYDNSPSRRDNERERHRGYDDEEPEPGYLRGTYDRDRDRDRDRNRDRDDYRRRDDSQDRDRDRNRERDRNWEEKDDRRSQDYDAPVRRTDPVRTRTPAPPPAPPSVSLDAPRPPAPAPSSSPAPQTKSMTADERAAFIRQQAQQRLQDRMRALGVSGSASATSTTIDTSVEDRLTKERREAEEKARQAERDAEEREAQRKQRLEGERAAAPKPPAVPSPPAPTPKVPPAPPTKKLGKAPPPPPTRHPVQAPRAPSTSVPASSPTPRLPVPPAAPVETEEDRKLREREEALKKKRVERQAEIERLEEEAQREQKRNEEDRKLREREEALKKKRAERQAEIERLEEEARREEEEHKARISALRQRTASPSTNGRGVPFAPSVAAAPLVSTPTALVPPVASSAPPPPPPAATSTTSASPDGPAPRNNPFHKLTQGSAAPSPVSAPANNPWTIPAGDSPASIQAPLASPAPPAPPAPPANLAISDPPAPKPPKPVSTADLDDWDDPIEKDDNSDSSDDEIIDRSARIDIANIIFGGRRSAGPEDAPTPPPAPPAPKGPAPAFKVSEEPANRGALFASIVGGTRLRPTKTSDRSASQFAGTVVGDAAPPPHVNSAPSPPSPSARAFQDSIPTSQNGTLKNNPPTATHEPTISEADEDDYVNLPDINVHPPADSSPELVTPVPWADPLADIDQTTVHKVRSLYPYNGQRPEDLSFGENLIIHASPSKSGNDWWYGTLERDGKKGFVPRSYVAVIDQGVQAKALYSYVGGSADELPFEQGDILSIVDRSEGDWWKADKGGVVFIVPPAYLEVLDVGGTITNLESEPNVEDGKGDTGDRIPLPGPSSMLAIRDASTPAESNVDDSDSDSDPSAYISFSDSESEAVEEDPEILEKRKAEDLEREVERARVLEAAGLILSHDPSDAPPVPPRKRKSTKVRARRPPPSIPQVPRKSPLPTERDLPPTPTSPHNSILTSEVDAYDKYESYKQSHYKETNRHSIASLTSNETPSSPASTFSPSISKEGESQYSRLSGSGFFGFLGRTSSQASSLSERKTPLVISGPVMSATEDPIGRSNSPAFGMSWCSLVDKAALNEIPAIERRRQEAIFELIATEAAYVRDLQLIVGTFYAPLLEMLTTQELAGIFANIEEILLCNTAFLSTLEDRQKESRLYVDTIADLLEGHAPNFEIYANYCVGQGPAIVKLKSLRESRQDLDAHLANLRNDATTRNLDLSSFLLIPMQRITRYPLLIRQVLNNTEPGRDKERTGLENSIRSIEIILERINEAIRDREGREVLAAISKDLWVGQGRLDLTAPTRYMGPRRLLRQGILVKKRRRLHAYLCTDILVLTDAAARSLYRMPISLIEAKAATTKDESTFVLHLAYPRGGDTLKLRATSVKDCQDWVRGIENAASACRRVARGLR